MAFNETTADRIRSKIFDLGIQVEEKKMFGGLSFLHYGKMTVGIVKDDLAVRILSPGFEDELASNSFVREMDFTKKPMKEFIYVEPKGFENDKDLEKWIEFGLAHAKSKIT